MFELRNMMDLCKLYLPRISFKKIEFLDPFHGPVTRTPRATLRLPSRKPPL